MQQRLQKKLHLATVDVLALLQI